MHVYLYITQNRLNECLHCQTITNTFQKIMHALRVSANSNKFLKKGLLVLKLEYCFYYTFLKIHFYRLLQSFDDRLIIWRADSDGKNKLCSFSLVEVFIIWILFPIEDKFRSSFFTNEIACLFICWSTGMDGVERCFP